MNQAKQKDLLQKQEKSPNTFWVVVEKLEQAGILHWPIQATSMSFYCILGVVPFLALCFSVARSFGLEAALDQAISSYFTTFNGQEEVLARIQIFAENLITNYSGSIMAFVALGLIFWSGYRILSIMELVLGDIFGFHPPRRIIRRLLDYFTVMVIVPLVLVAGAAVNIYLTGLATSTWSLPGGINPKGFFSIFVFISPYLMWWLLLSWTYAYFSHGLVGWRDRLLGGGVSGLCFQLFQTLYIKIMFDLTSYNAIYASFASIPLFMIWLYCSWLIVMAGGEITRRFSDYFTLKTSFFGLATPPTWASTTEQCRQIMAEIIHNYNQNPIEGGTTFRQLSQSTMIAMPGLGMALNRLLAARLVVRVSKETEDGSPSFLPARSPEQLTDDQIMKDLANSCITIY